MEILSSWEDYQGGPSAVTVGKFDGVHLGHRLLAKRLYEQKKKGLRAVVVTFDSQPAARTQHKDIRWIVTKEERQRLWEEAGADTLIELAFTDAFMRIPPEEFIRLLKHELGMKYLVVGSDFRFGFRGEGDISLLKKLSSTYDFTLDVMEKKQCQKRDISSTYIREEISAGHIDNANRLLGYPYYIIGIITHGNHIGSTKLSYPTINMLPSEEKLLPPHGVYITEVIIDGRSYKGITNVGIRPSVEEAEKRVGIETHILDFKADIYGKYAKIVFLSFVRFEKKFDRLADLKAQIGEDVKIAYAYFNGRSDNRP